MEPDNNEAFIHNVCKKTAQLAKVASEFNNAHFDQSVKLKRLQKRHEEFFDQIIEHTRKNAQDAFNKLVKYRKAMIEDSCHEFGLQYKQTKSDFAQTLNEKSTQLNNISREIKQQNRNIKEITRDSIIFAKSVLTTADEVEKSLKLQTRCQSPNITQDVRDRMNNIRAKSEAEKKRSQCAITEMREHYKGIAIGIKEQVKSIILQEVRNRKTSFMELLEHVRKLKNETGELKEKEAEAENKIILFNKEAIEKRNRILSETKTEYKKLIMQKERTIVEIKEESRNGDDRVNIAKKLLKTLRQDQKKIINELAKLIESQRNDLRNVEKSIAQRRKDRIEMLSREEANFMNKQKSEMQMKLDEIKLQQQIIEERKLTTEYLDDKSRELKEMFMNELNENQSKFSNNLKKDEFDLQTHFNEQTEKYRQLNEGLINSLKEKFTAISDESRHNRKIVRKASHKMKKEITESHEVNSKKLEEKQNENANKLKEFEAKLNENAKERTIRR